MSPKVLLRCSLCGKFHAAYLVVDAELGQLRLCYSCWQSKYAPPVDAEGQPKPVSQRAEKDIRSQKRRK
ncbi:MAG: hypothetical protein EHM81_12495 [Chloroflexi bacterium]|nr:MAG: hypothetical protein EHM81_12495 [Chloroflexota bacterium]